jgi:ParB/RepB/Spo0J family partition protein
MDILLEKIVQSSGMQFRQDAWGTPEDIALQASIAEIGMQNFPTVRHLNLDQYEVVQGHRRIAAARALGWASVECTVLEIGVEEAHRISIQENSMRSNLTPLEMALTMQAARKELGLEYTSKLWNVTPQTVLSYLRILDLPEPLRLDVHSGKIAKSAVPGLIAVYQGMGEKATISMVHEATKEHGDIGSAELISRIRNHMSYTTAEFNPLDGGNGTKVDFPLNKMFPIKPSLTKKADKIMEEAGIPAAYVEEFNKMAAYIAAGTNLLLQPWLVEPIPQIQMERVVAYVAPPACNDCPLNVTVKETVYCTFKPCLLRKKMSWGTLEFERALKKFHMKKYSQSTDGIGIAIDEYDGPYRREDKTKENKYKTMLAKGEVEHLRLQEHHCQGGEWIATGNEYAQVVDCTPVAIKQAKKEGRKRANDNANTQSRQPTKAEKEAQAAKQAAIELQGRVFTRFFKEYLLDLMVSKIQAGIPELMVFRNIDDADVQRYFGKNIKVTDGNRLDYYRRLSCLPLTQRWGEWEAKREGALSVVDKYKGVLTTLGVTLPEGFDAKLQSLLVEEGALAAEAGPVAVAERLQTVAAEWDVKLPTEEEAEETDEEEDE